MNEKTLVIIGTLATIILGIFGSLIAWLCGGKDLTGKGREVIRQIFNFQLTMLIVSIVTFWIPIVGQLIGLVIWVLAIFYAIKGYLAYDKGEEFKAISFINVK